MPLGQVRLDLEKFLFSARGHQGDTNTRGSR